MGMPGVPAQHSNELAVANVLVRRTVLVARALADAGATFIIENPPDRGDGPLYQAKFASHAPLWLVPEVVEPVHEVSNEAADNSGEDQRGWLHDIIAWLISNSLEVEGLMQSQKSSVGRCWRLAVRAAPSASDHAAVRLSPRG